MNLWYIMIRNHDREYLYMANEMKFSIYVYNLMRSTRISIDKRI